MDWYPQQLFTDEQAAAGFFVFVNKHDAPFLKRCVLGSPTPVTAEQAAAGASSFSVLFNNNMPFLKNCLLWSRTANIGTFVNIYRYVLMHGTDSVSSHCVIYSTCILSEKVIC